MVALWVINTPLDMTAKPAMMLRTTGCNVSSNPHSDKPRASSMVLRNPNRGNSLPVSGVISTPSR